ncbi:MAG TPA: S-methyl-5-thioribose-1-phosphate isomerase [Jatrophihabitantaceae bacterium]|nr:S-methyl-5-thioribose-1-phosphate isomerase [Jatrophihabitantaceae bacterium]
MVVVRTIDWVDDHIVLLDQTRLPREECQLHVRTVDELVDAISRLAVRGAPALGAAGALGVVLAAQEGRRSDWDDATLQHAIARLRAARPTAVNLARGVDRVLARLPDGADAVRNEALRVLADDGTVNRAIGETGSRLLLELVGDADRVRVYTHCNTGALATVEWGTALGIVRALQALDRLGLVYVGETRPLLQGSRLTAWELDRLGADYRIVVDGAGPGVIARRMIDAVVVGADRVTANGDVINKVGTFPLALAAARAGVPFVVAAPESTVDAETPSGDDVRIELRSPDEVLSVGATRTAPEGAQGFNPAFDITPADLVTALVTERRVVRLAAGEVPA